MVLKSPLKARISVLPVTYFFLGFFSILAQTLMIREFLVVLYGNELVLGLLFFNWLTGIFAGAWIGSAITDRGRPPAPWFCLSLLVMGLLLPLGIVGSRFLYVLTATPAGTYIGFFKVLAFSALMIMPPALLAGFSFPLAARIQLPGQTSRAQKVQKISHIYIFEGLGFLVGGIFYTFYLAGRFGPFFVAALAALPLVVSASYILTRSRKYIAAVFTMLALVVHGALLLPPLGGKLESWTAEGRWESVAAMPRVYSVDSKYQNIAVGLLGGQYSLYLNSQFTATFPGEEDNSIKAAHLVCQHPGPKKVLIIGEALSGLAGSLLAYPLSEVRSVEIDPRVVQTLLKFLPEKEKEVLGDRRFRIDIQDGRKFVKTAADSGLRFDLVYLNMPEPSTLLLNRYYTRNFFMDAAKILAPSGVLALKVTSSENYVAGLVGDYTASIYRTVKSVFPEIVVAPGTENFIFASRQAGVVTDRPEILSQRYTETGVQPEQLGFIFYSLYPEEKTDFTRSALEESGKKIINRDDFPISNFYFGKILGWYGGGGLPGLMDIFEKVGIFHWLGILLLLTLTRFIVLSKRKSPVEQGKGLKFHALVAVAVCGMAGLALEMIILYIFQNAFGYVYHAVGLVIAVFMFGLPLGATVSNRWLGRKRGPREADTVKLLILLQLGLALTALGLSQVNCMLAETLAINQAVIFFLTVLVGFVVGMVFPLVIYIYLSGKEKTGKAAGIVDACDHLGAALGALFLGTLFLPLIGVCRMCLLVASALVLSTLLLSRHVKNSPPRR